MGRRRGSGSSGDLGLNPWWLPLRHVAGGCGCGQRVTFRRLDEADLRPSRLLGALPGLRLCDQRVPIGGDWAPPRGAGLGERVEPSLRRRSSAAAGAFLGMRD